MEFSYVDVENSMLPDQEALPTAPAKPRAKRACQVPGCTADLDAIGKPYCCLKRICPEHMKADAIPVYGQIMRYCQQCGTLEPLTMFQSNKRSCKGSLARRSKRPAQQERRKRREAGSFGPSSSNETSSISWGAAAFPAAAADAAAGTATGVCGDVLDMDPNWGSSMMDGASVLPCSDIWGAAAVTAAASWGGNWLEQPAAAATAVPAAAAVTAPACTPGVAAMATIVTADLNAHAAAVTSCAAAGMPWQQQPVQLQPPCTQELSIAPAGINCLLDTSCSSSSTMDPAVLELEQVMLQELAAAGVLAMDSSSAARLPLPPAAFTAPAQQQLDSVWQSVQMPQQQQQQKQAPVLPVLQHQCSGVYTDMQQPWKGRAVSPTAAGQYHTADVSTAAPAAVHNTVAGMMGGAGTMQPPAVAAVVPTGCAPAAAALVGGAAGQHGHKAQVMAHLQGRLYALQSQMEDMQLMLGLLQNA